MVCNSYVNPLRRRRNRRHFADDIFNCIFLNENVWISLKISLKFVPTVQINNIPALVQIIAWRRSGDKPLSEPMVISLLTHIIVAWPQCVNSLNWLWISDAMLGHRSGSTLVQVMACCLTAQGLVAISDNMSYYCKITQTLQCTRLGIRTFWSFWNLAVMSLHQLATFRSLSQDFYNKTLSVIRKFPQGLGWLLAFGLGFLHMAIK